MEIIVTDVNLFGCDRLSNYNTGYFRFFFFLGIKACLDLQNNNNNHCWIRWIDQSGVQHDENLMKAEKEKQMVS